MHRLYVLAKAACSRINITEMMNYTQAVLIYFYSRGRALIVTTTDTCMHVPGLPYRTRVLNRLRVTTNGS